MNNQNKIFNQNNLLALSLIALLGTRVTLFVYNSYALFSYDYSFYLYAIKNSLNFSVIDLLTGLSGGYNSWFFYLIKQFGLPGQFILNTSFLLASICSGLCFYLIFQKRSFASGIFSILLIAFSPIQTEAYNIFLWKNIVVLPILLLAFKFLEEENWNWLVFFSLLILTTHRTTAIIYFLTLLIYFLFKNYATKKIKNVILLLIFAGTGFTILLFIPTVNNLVNNLLNNPNSYVKSGLFLEQRNLFLLSWPIFLLAACGFWKQVKTKINILWLIFTSLCLLWFIFQLPFYRRILIYLDLGLIYYTAYFLGQINYKYWITKLSLACLLIYLFIFNLQFTSKTQQLITKAQIQEIKNFTTKNPGDFVITTSANNAPWLLGFSNNIRLAAPGLFEDRNNYQDWQNFWQGQNQDLFLSKYPRPLYFYQRDYFAPGPINNCLKPISENFSEYICK